MTCGVCGEKLNKKSFFSFKNIGMGLCDPLCTPHIMRNDEYSMCISAERSRPYLITHDSNESTDYINAVYVDVSTP